MEECDCVTGDRAFNYYNMVTKVTGTCRYNLVHDDMI